MESQLMLKVRNLLDALGGTTGEPGDLTCTLQHIAQTAKSFFAADACVIFAINPITNHFLGSLTVAGNLLKRDNLSYKQSRPEGTAPQVLKQGVLLVEDLEAAPEYHSIFTRSEGIRSFVGLALHLKHSQKPLGILYLNFKQLQKFSSDDLELLQFFADQASFILQETWLLQRYQSVAHIGQEINHELATVDIFFKKLQKHVASILDTSYALLLAVYQPQTNTLDMYLEEEGTFILQDNNPLGGACQHVIETQQTLFIRHMSKEAQNLSFQRAEIITGTESKESLIFVPLFLRGVPLGVLSIQHPMPNAYNQEDVFILQLLANHVALALHSMRLYTNLFLINEIGQLLTQQLESEQTLQATVDKIREATEADVVVLYPYEPISQSFLLPPRLAGTLLASSILSMSPWQPNNIAAQMLRRKKPIFAKNSRALYNELQSNIHIRQGNFVQREKIYSTAAMPLRVGDESVGVLFVNFRQPQRFDASQKLFIEGLTHYAAIAIKNAQMFGTLSQRRINELEILQYIDRELSSTLELDFLLSTLLRLAHEQVPAEEAAILLYNPRTKILEAAAAIGHHAEARQKLNIPLQDTKGITRWVLEHKKPARVVNVHRDLPWKDLYIQTASDIVSELDVPLLDGEEVVGVLNFGSTREGAFRQEDQDFLLTMAGQAVLAIKNAQVYEREKRLVAEGQVLNEISKEITSQLDLIHVFDLILEKALELTSSTSGYLMLYDPDLNDLWMAAERGVAKDKKGKRMGLDQGIAGYVATGKQRLNVDPSQPPWNEIYLDYIPGTRSELAVPMLAGNEIRGVLNVESPTPNNFSESDERLLQGLADLAVVALQNAQAYEREKRLVAEGQVLNEISKEITSQLDLTHVFNLILEKALALTHSTLGSLHLYDRDLNDLIMVAERGVVIDKKGQRQRLDQGIVGHAAVYKQLYNVGDISQPPWNNIHVELFPGTRSELAVPMLAGVDLRGVLNVESPTPNNFSESDERLLQGLADLAVIALQNAERYHQAERETQRFELLYQAGQELGKISDLEQLEQAYEVVVQIADRQSQSQVVIYLYDEINAEVILKCASPYRQGPLFDRIKLNEGLNGQVARERKTIVIHNIDNLPPDIISIKQSDPRMHSFVVTPVMFKDQYYGNLGLRHEDIGHFQGADILFFEGLAQQLASTIHRLETAQARQEFEQRALTAEEMSAIGQSAFEVTHRLGNDLGLVELYVTDIESELEKQGVTNTFVSKKLENILQSVQAVLSFSTDLKEDLAKLGAKEDTAGEPVIMAPKVLLEEAANNVSSLPSNIQIGLEIDDGVAAVRVIHSLAADILHNLVANAIQAMPLGGKITLRARNAGRSVALEVTDTGLGIPPEKLPKIFDLFFSTKGSSGFGLWSARRNALKNHGDLKVDSKPGQGTTFTLLFPKTDERTP